MPFKFDIHIPSEEQAFVLLARSYYYLPDERNQRHQLSEKEKFFQNTTQEQQNFLVSLSQAISNGSAPDTMAHRNKSSFYEYLQQLFAEKDNGFAIQFHNTFYEKLSEKDFSHVASQINRSLDLLSECYKSFEDISTTTNFLLAQSYEIQINPFDTLLKYLPDTPPSKEDSNAKVISIGILKQKTKPDELDKVKRLAYCIGHEIVHLGIQKIVAEHKLTHEQEERFADLLGNHIMGNHLGSFFQAQFKNISCMDNFYNKFITGSSDQCLTPVVCPYYLSFLKKIDNKTNTIE